MCVCFDKQKKSHWTRLMLFSSLLNFYFAAKQNLKHFLVRDPLVKWSEEFDVVLDPEQWNYWRMKMAPDWSVKSSQQYRHKCDRREKGRGKKERERTRRLTLICSTGHTHARDRFVSSCNVKPSFSRLRAALGNAIRSRGIFSDSALLCAHSFFTPLYPVLLDAS